MSVTAPSSGRDFISAIEAATLADLILAGSWVAPTLQGLSLRLAGKLSAVGYGCGIFPDKLIELEDSKTRSRAVDFKLWDASCGVHWFVRLHLLVHTNVKSAGITEVRALLLDSTTFVSGEREILRAHELLRGTPLPGQFQPESEQTIEGWARHIQVVF